MMLTAADTIDGAKIATHVVVNFMLDLPGGVEY